MDNKLPSIIRFEKAVESKSYQEATQELILIISQIDKDMGIVGRIECPYPVQLAPLPQEPIIYFCTKMSDLIATLFKDPGFVVEEKDVETLFFAHRWISSIFASSPYVNTDHILYSYSVGDSNQDPTALNLPQDRNIYTKFFLLFSPESNINLNFNKLWEIAPDLTASLCFALQTARFIGTPQAFSKREFLLDWFPEKLEQRGDIGQYASALFHDVYLNCSYATNPSKHRIKASINYTIRNFLEARGWEDRVTTKLGKKNGKPVMIVLLEHFSAGHSIYRTHSTSLIAAKKHFHIIGLGYDRVDEVGREVFDEFQELGSGVLVEQLEEIKEICQKNQAAVLYMPSIGMERVTILASNTRLAPIQVIALGHPATTHSKYIDYVVVEDDYVGSEACFSESMIRLPKDALPYVPSAMAPEKVDYYLNKKPDVVNIGIASTSMKLNYHFLETLKTIQERSQVKIHYHLALGMFLGVASPYIERFVKSYLGDNVTIYPHAPYTDYLENLRACDMMINPFPFGNTNGIIDMVTLGLVGICKTGEEVHEHIDEGLFKRLGLPKWLVTHSIEEYIKATLRLAENHEERLAIREKIIKKNKLKTLFSGNPKPLGNKLAKELDVWMQKNHVSFE